MLSGILYSSFNIKVLDATVMHLSERQALDEIIHFSPDYIIFITGIVSLKHDFNFLIKVKELNTNAQLIGIGDVFRDTTFHEKQKWLDAVLYDFTTDDIMHYCRNNFSYVHNMTYRKNGAIIQTDMTINDKQEFTIPVPRHELFLDNKYTFPFAKCLPFTTILTDFGCPYSCSFCTYRSMGIKFRTVENVCDEFNYIHDLGIQELFIKDQTFGWKRDRTIQLCSHMINHRWDFSWTAFSRVDVVDKEMLSIMKEAGCHTLTFGVETANDIVRKKYNKNFQQEQVEHAFALCKEVGIETVGTFIIGFPYETRENILETINFARRIPCDFAAFNCFVPKSMNSHNGDDSKNDYVNKDTEEACDQSGIISIAGNGLLSGKEITELLTYAVWHFYMRPQYLISRILHLSSWAEATLFLKNGMSMIMI